jgi:hypothetical protein
MDFWGGIHTTQNHQHPILKASTIIKANAAGDVYSVQDKFVWKIDPLFFWCTKKEA